MQTVCARVGAREMDLQNIQDQLNTEFSKSDTRIIFWFDDKGEYEDEVSEIQTRYLSYSWIMQNYIFWMERTGFTPNGY